MWHNSQSSCRLFWHLSQWQCTSNPVMTFCANPGYQTAHPPRRHPNQALFNRDEKKIWLLNCLSLTTQCPNSNQRVLYTQHAQNNSFHSEKLKISLNLSLAPASFPFLRTLKSHNHFPFILSLHKKPLILLVLISYSKGKTKEFSETHALLPWRGNWADNATVAWHGLCIRTFFFAQLLSNYTILYLHLQILYIQ